MMLRPARIGLRHRNSSGAAVTGAAGADTVSDTRQGAVTAAALADSRRVHRLNELTRNLRSGSAGPRAPLEEDLAQAIQSERSVGQPLELSLLRASDESPGLSSTLRDNHAIDFLAIDKSEVEATRLIIDDVVAYRQQSITETFWNGGSGRAIERQDSPSEAWELIIGQRAG